MSSIEDDALSAELVGRVFSYFGANAVAHLCNVPIDRLATSTDPEIRSAMRTVVPVLDQVRAAAQAAGQPALGAVMMLADATIDGKHVMSEWRRGFGSPISSTGLVPDDAVSASLFAASTLAYPYVLMSAHAEHHVSLGMILAKDQALKDAVGELAALLRADVDLAVWDQWREDADAATGHMSDFLTLSAATHFVEAPVILERLRGGGGELLGRCCQEIVDIGRGMTRPGGVAVPFFAGFYNVGIESASGDIPLPWGSLRPITGQALDFFPYASSLPSSEGTEKYHGLLLETTTRRAVEVIHRGEGEPRELTIRAVDPEAQLRRKLELTSFSVALGLTSGPPVAATYVWGFAVEPLMLPQPGREHSGKFARIVDLDEVSEVQSWAERLWPIDDHVVAPARRRIMRALSERHDPEDGLIDVVIAWENLFGGSYELSFRVSVGMALTLEDDELKRRSLQKEISKLYNLRSKLVHAASIPKSFDSFEKMQAARTRAIELALDSFRRLYLLAPSLIEDEQRGVTIILRGGLKPRARDGVHRA